MILNIGAASKGEPNFIKQTLENVKVQVKPRARGMVDVNNSLSLNDKSSQQKSNKCAN